MLKAFDWYYDYSDDLSVWKKGNAAEKELDRIAAVSEEHKELSEKFIRYRTDNKKDPESIEDLK